MKKITYPQSKKTIVRDLNKLPKPGSYYSRITDARLEVVEPFDGVGEDTCFVLEYTLENVITHEKYDFVETYYPTTQSPRSKSLFDHLRENGYDFNDDRDDTLVGTLERVEIVWEYLGVYAYPIITHRELLFLSQGNKDAHRNM